MDLLSTQAELYLLFFCECDLHLQIDWQYLDISRGDNLVAIGL